MARAIPYYFPGKFSPPNKYDLSIVNWLIRKTYDVSSVTIVVGKTKDDFISIDQKVDLWKDFLRLNLDGNISVIKDEVNSPLAAIYKIQERSREDAFGIATTPDIAKNEDFKSTFSYFPNYEVILVPSYESENPDNLRASLEQDDFKTFSRYMPDAMSVEEKQKIFSSLKPAPIPEENPVLSEDYWRTVAKSIVNNFK